MTLDVTVVWSTWLRGMAGNKIKEMSIPVQIYSTVAAIAETSRVELVGHQCCVCAHGVSTAKSLGFVLTSKHLTVPLAMNGKTCQCRHQHIFQHLATSVTQRSTDDGLICRPRLPGGIE